MRYLPTIYKKLLEFQSETDPDNKEAVLDELREYIELHPSIIFPSSIYPFLSKVFAEYPAEFSEDLESLIPHLQKQKNISRSLEVEFHRVICQVKSGTFETIEDIAEILYRIISSQISDNIAFHDSQHRRHLESQYQVLKTSFTAQKAAVFFESLFDRFLTDSLQEQFVDMEEVFWYQLKKMFQAKAIFVNPATRKTRFVRLDIEVTPLAEGPDEVRFENDVDQNMLASGYNAVKAARLFLKNHSPGIIEKRFFRITCRFENPLVAYHDTSASLLIGVSIVGLLLDLEVRPHILISGEVDDSGKVLPVDHIPEKVEAVALEPDIHRILLPKKNLPEIRDHIRKQTNQTLKVSTVRSFNEAIHQYYGQQQLPALRHRGVQSLHKKSHRILKIFVGFLTITFLALVISLCIVGSFVNASRNYGIGFLSQETCLAPPPQTNPCPFSVPANITFPLRVQQCQKVSNNAFYMQTDAELTHTGKLNAETIVLSDSYLLGFSGKATVYFCHGSEPIHAIGYRWGVNGRAIWGADSHRKIHWDCPKGDDTPACRKRYTQIVSADVVENTTYLHIVQVRDSSRSPMRIETILRKIDKFISSL